MLQSCSIPEYRKIMVYYEYSLLLAHMAYLELISFLFYKTNNAIDVKLFCVHHSYVFKYDMTSGTLMNISKYYFLLCFSILFTTDVMMASFSLKVGVSGTQNSDKGSIGQRGR